MSGQVTNRRSKCGQGCTLGRTVSLKRHKTQPLPPHLVIAHAATSQLQPSAMLRTWQNRASLILLAIIVHGIFGFSNLNLPRLRHIVPVTGIMLSSANARCLASRKYPYGLPVSSMTQALNGLRICNVAIVMPKHMCALCSLVPIHRQGFSSGFKIYYLIHKVVASLATTIRFLVQTLSNSSLIKTLLFST